MKEYSAVYIPKVQSLN